MKCQVRTINGFRLCAFESRAALLDELRLGPNLLVAINAEKIYSANPILQEISVDGIGYADGIGAVLAARRAGAKKAIRIPGSELWIDIVRAFSSDSTFYLIGSTEIVIEDVVRRLGHEYPGLRIVGYRDGFLDEDGIRELETDLTVKKPNFVFVAQGSPKQELLMNRLSKVHAAVYMGLGGSFDVYTNTVHRAPKLFRENGLEWFYRVLTQPQRITRYWVLLPFFVNLIRGKY